MDSNITPELLNDYQKITKNLSYKVKNCLIEAEATGAKIFSLKEKIAKLELELYYKENHIRNIEPWLKLSTFLQVATIDEAKHKITVLYSYQKALSSPGHRLVGVVSTVTGIRLIKRVYRRLSATALLFRES
jgi:hypothetical protein